MAFSATESFARLVAPNVIVFVVPIVARLLNIDTILLTVNDVEYDKLSPVGLNPDTVLNVVSDVQFAKLVEKVQFKTLQFTVVKVQF